MDTNVIKLILTDEGRKRINDLLKAKATVSLMVGLGDGNTAPSKNSSQLSHECERVEPSFLNNDDKAAYWHINASFPPMRHVWTLAILQ